MITGSQIEARFVVKPETGEIFRNAVGSRYQSRLLGFIKPGSRSLGGGYRIISVPIANRKYKRVRAHQLVWAWVYGEWPKHEVDHIDGNRDNNSISNLRRVTVAENRTNKSIQSNNKANFKWVYRDCQRPNTWRAEVTYRDKGGLKKKFRTFGHKTPDAAYEAASKFAQSAHGKFYNPGKHWE